jgi:hypothetical protein
LDTIPGLTELERRREALLVESELNRQALRLEILQVSMSIERVRHGFVSGQAVWKWAAPVVGFFLARKFTRFGAGGGVKSSSLLSMGRSLWNAWKDRRRSTK